MKRKSLQTNKYSDDWWKRWWMMIKYSDNETVIYSILYYDITEIINCIISFQKTVSARF